MRQVIVTVELLEYNLEAFPAPQAPKAIFTGSRTFFDEEADQAIEATKFLANRVGLDCDL